MEKIHRTDEEWRRLLTPEQYHVTREHGTEPPFRNKYCDHHQEGVYQCSNCGLDLFSSKMKFDSGTGWPSFLAPVQPDHLLTQTDTSHGMNRTEVLCARCDAHLGHLFQDGPPPTGMRYCMNSAALSFSDAVPEQGQG